MTKTEKIVWASCTVGEILVIVGAIWQFGVAIGMMYLGATIICNVLIVVLFRIRKSSYAEYLKMRDKNKAFHDGVRAKLER